MFRTRTEEAAWHGSDASHPLASLLHKHRGAHERDADCQLVQVFSLVKLDIAMQTCTSIGDGSRMRFISLARLI